MAIFKKQKIEELGILTFILLLVGSGVYFRLIDVGKWCFATDEYYMAESISKILTHGIPVFSNGGFYVRGIFFQYFEALLSLLLGFNEGTLRYGAVFFNLLTLPGLYLLGKKLGGKYLGLTVVGIFSVSLWEIEFSRFIRMYTIFQCLFVWYVFFLIRAVVDQDQSSFKWLYFFACFSLFVYKGAIFLVLLLFVPLLFELPTNKRNHFIISSIILFCAYYYLTFDFRHFGTGNHLPPGFQEIEHSSAGFFRLKLYFLKTVFESPFWTLGLLIIVVFHAIFMGKLWKDGGLTRTKKVVFTLIMLLSLMQLYGACFVLLAMSLVLEKLRVEDLSNHAIKQVFECIGVTFGFWFLYGLFNDSWIKYFEDLTEISVKKILVVLLKWPNIFDTFIYPFLKASPVIFGYILFSLLYLIYTLSFYGKNSKYALRIVVIISVISMCILGIVNTTYYSTRYSFFLYPLLILVFSYVVKDILDTLGGLRYRPAIFFCLTLFVFFISDDFDLNHLANIGSPEINFRKDFDKHRLTHFYQRVDFRSPSYFINDNVGPNDIVISTMQPPSHYLNNLDYVFLSAKSGKFSGVSILNGTKEFWTSSRLIYKYNDLMHLINSSLNNIWIIEYTEKYPWRNEDERKISKRFSKYEVYTSVDGSVRVLKIFDHGGL